MANLTPKRLPLLERIAGAAELGRETVGLEPLLNLWGNRRLDVDGCRGITGYSETEVVVNTGKMLLRIEGRGLELTALEGERLSVCGHIQTLHFLD